MPKRVGIEWEESQYTTEASNLESFHSAMESTGSQFTSQVETSNSNLDTAMSSVEGSWSDDDVFSKLKSMVNDTLKDGLEKIDTDVTSGSFLSLKNTVNLCKTCMDNCKQAKHNYDVAKNLFDRTSPTKTVDDPDNPGKKKTVDNDLYDTRQADAEKKLNILKNKVASANTHLYELAQFAFGGPSSKNNIGGQSTTGAGGIGATPQSDTPSTPEGIPEGATQFGKDIGGNDQNFYAAETTLGDTNVKVYYDADTGNRVYINPETGEVAVCYRHEDGSVKVMMTTTGDRNHFGNSNDHMGGAEGLLETMRECTRVANEGSGGKDLINSQLDVHVNNWNVNGDFDVGSRGGYGSVETVLGEESWTNPS